ncbi:MAG: hypothetical protein QNJ94_18555 [Alphaproteobacteria bacterium]|nr:hypothetical protein [Alphaproteobacteria bacterium]
MAFVLNQLNAVGGQSRANKKNAAGVMSVWTYFHASDNLAAVKAAGYFNSARSLLTPGDVIIFSANGAACDIITIALVPATGNVTSQSTDINSA